MKSPDKVLSTVGKATAGTMRFTDRLMGTSARKMRVKMDNLAEVNRKIGTAVGQKSPVLDKIYDDYSRSAKALTARSNSTRIKTGLVIGGAALANKAMNNHQEAMTQNYTQQYQYQYQ